MVLSEVRADARAKLKGKWGKAVLMGIIFSLINVLFSFLGFIPMANLVLLIIEPVLAFGLVASYIRLSRGEEVGYLDFFKSGFSLFGKVWGTIFRTFLKIILPFIVYFIGYCIILFGVISVVKDGAASQAELLSQALPFMGIGSVIMFIGLVWLVIKTFSYVLTDYILFDNQDMKCIDIVNKSEEMMKGYKFKYFCLGLSFIGWALLSIVTLGIGFLWLAPYMQVAQISFYEKLSAGDSTTEGNPISEQ